MEQLKSVLQQFGKINKEEILYHGSPNDFDIVDLSFTDTLFFGFDPLLSLAILTEKIDSNHCGYLYCVQLNRDLQLPPQCCSFTSPIFLSKPQEVGDCEWGENVWGTKKVAKTWDTSMLLFPMKPLKEQVEIPKQYIQDAKVVAKLKINVEKLRQVLGQYATEKDVEADIVHIIHSCSEETTFY